MKQLFTFSVVIMLFLSNEETSVAQTRDRSQIPEKYTWDLTPIYPSDEAYLEAKDALVKKFDQILNYKGKLGQSADQLYACLNLNSEISKEMARLACARNSRNLRPNIIRRRLLSNLKSLKLIQPS
jgi:oligoendopeptidase F